jgi:hypothetical protein
MTKAQIKEADLLIFQRTARAINTALEVKENDFREVDIAYYQGIRASACEVYAQLSAFYVSPKRSDFLKACGVWEPKDGNR